MRQEGYNEKSDIWALGCLLYEMCALKYVFLFFFFEFVLILFCFTFARPPFDAHSHDVLNVKIKAGKFTRLAKYSEELNRVVRLMLDIDPANRPDVVALLQLMPVRICVRERKVNQQYALCSDQLFLIVWAAVTSC